MASKHATEALTKLWPVIEYHAYIFNGVGGAEFDDLVQEGAIAAWLTLESGYVPSNEVIRRAMKDWIRFISHRGLSHAIFEPLET
jgi:hypothetical protein